MKKTYQITEAGKADLEKELAELKGRRGEIAEKIAVARDFGELSENAEYDAVGLGSTVELQCPERTVSYTVVGPVEADPLAGRISDQSPIGKELIGKKIGDEVTIKTPKAEITYIIKSIS